MVRQLPKASHMLPDWNFSAEQKTVHRSLGMAGVIDIVTVNSDESRAALD